MPIENTTPNRGYQLPASLNFLEDDVLRLIAFAMAVDLDFANALIAIAGKADSDHGHVMADITGLPAALAAKQDTSGRGIANGYAALGSDGKVPSAQLPDALFGALNYRGDWNANTNNPVIPAASSANKGWYYMVSTAGTTTVSGINDWEVGDWIVSDGTKWAKIDNTDAVVSVAGLKGAIGAVALKAALAIAVADVSGLGTAAAKAISDFATAAQGAKADKAVLVDADASLTGGYNGTAVDDGTKSSGTYTPSPAGGNWRKISRAGAFTLAAPSAAGSYNMTIDITNAAGAGAVTFSGFATGYPKGDSLTTTSGHKFKLHIAKSDIGVTGYIEALQ